MNLATTLSGLAPAAPADRGLGPAHRRPRHGPAASRTRAPPLSCCARFSRRRSRASRWPRSSTPRATAIPSPRPRATLPSPESALGPDEYLEHLRRVKAAVAGSGDRLPQRHDPRRLDLATPACWSKRARDALELDLYHAASDPSTSGAEVEAPDGRDRARGEAGRPHSGGGQALAPLHGLRPLRTAARRRGGRRSRPLHALPPGRPRRARARGGAHFPPVGLLRPRPAVARGGGPGRARQGFAGRHGRSPHRPGRGEGHDGGGARHPARLALWFRTAPGTCGRSAPSSKPGWPKTSGPRSTRCGAT